MYQYQQLANALKEEILSGNLQKGDKLPSIRELVALYGVNKDTVQRALRSLKDESFIYAVEKSGYYVLKNSEAKQLEESEADYSQLPIEDLRICFNQSLASAHDLKLTRKEQASGMNELIQALMPILEEYGVYAAKEQLVITTGTQQALYILLQLIQGKKVLLEQPTYARMNELVKHLNIPYESIERQMDGGIDLNRLEELFASGEFSLFYTISRFHNPLGGSYSESTKKKIVELASKYSVYIIEDDYMADFVEGNATPLHYYDMDGRVIYVKSFSSILFSALKIGIVVLPKELVEPFAMRKQWMDYDSNVMMQKTFTLFIENGMFAKHRKAMVEDYSEKSKRAKDWMRSKGIQEGILHGTQWVFKKTPRMDEKLQAMNLKAKPLDEYFISKNAPALERLDLAKIREN